MYYFKVLRISHWLKNLIIFIPVILVKNFDSKWIEGIFAFLSFSFIASAGYIFNDINDIASDRNHPKKKYRVLASGKVSVTSVIYLMVILILGSFLIAMSVNHELIYYLLAYCLLHILYTKYFKRIAFVDILFLTSFYLIRLFFGAVSTDTYLTGWLVVFMFFAMLSLSIEKRHAELMIANSDLEHRGYTTDDVLKLNIIKYVSVFTSLLVLNIHAYIILNITIDLFYAFLNILGVALVFLFFKENRNDDIVQKVYTNIPLLVISLLLLILYLMVI